MTKNHLGIIFTSIAIGTLGIYGDKDHFCGYSVTNCVSAFDAHYGSKDFF